MKINQKTSSPIHDKKNFLLCLFIYEFITQSNYRWFLPWLYLHLTILIGCMVLIIYIVFSLSVSYSDPLFKVFLFCLFNNFLLTYCFLCIHSMYEELRWDADNLPLITNDLVPVPNKVIINCDYVDDKEYV